MIASNADRSEAQLVLLAYVRFGFWAAGTLSNCAALSLLPRVCPSMPDARPPDDLGAHVTGSQLLITVILEELLSATTQCEHMAALI